VIARLLLDLLADVVLGSVVSKNSFSTEMNRYLERTGLIQHSAAPKASAR